MKTSKKKTFEKFWRWQHSEFSYERPNMNLFALHLYFNNALLMNRFKIRILNVKYSIIRCLLPSMLYYKCHLKEVLF